MNDDRRTERIAAGLEKQFRDFQDKLDWCWTHFAEQGCFGVFELNHTTTLMRATTQLAATIARLEALSARDAARENRGSIPQ